MQPLANVLIKTNKVGSTVPRLNVTPAECFVLIAQFRDEAGDNPIVKLEEVPEDREELQIAPLLARHKALKEKYTEEQMDRTITEEARNVRLQSTSAAIIRLEENIKEWQYIKALRSLGPAEEKARLMGRYPNKLVEHLFPGRFPSVPKTYDDAKQVGLDSNLLAGMTGTRESFFHTAHIS